MMNTSRQYADLVIKCLATYQFIEEGLRFCLVRYQATTLFRLHGFLPFRTSALALEDAAMGRLIEWLRTYCEDESLLRQLRKAKTQRDRVAHRSLAFTLQEQSDEDLLQRALAELTEAHADAEACFTALLKEMGRADQAVNRAYSVLSNERAASEQPLPEPFIDTEPEES